MPETTVPPTLTAKLASVLTPRAQVYVHVHVDNLNNPNAVARVEGAEPILVSQIANLTRASKVRVTPVVHVGAGSIAVDAYEIPDQIREEVLARDIYEVFPWSSREARGLDIDHTDPYRSGLPGQTRIGNLGPLSRKAHRIKTHGGWRLKQPQPGVFIWRTPAGQQVRVDHAGSHPIDPG